MTNRGILADLHIGDNVNCVFDHEHGPILAVTGQLVRWEGRHSLVINRWHDDEPIVVPADSIRSIAQIDGPALTEHEVREQISG